MPHFTRLLAKRNASSHRPSTRRPVPTFRLRTSTSAPELDSIIDKKKNIKRSTVAKPTDCYNEDTRPHPTTKPTNTSVVQVEEDFHEIPVKELCKQIVKKGLHAFDKNSTWDLTIAQHFGADVSSVTNENRLDLLLLIIGEYQI